MGITNGKLLTKRNRYEMTGSSELKSFKSALKTVDNRYSIRLFVGLGIIWPLSVIYERSALKTGILDAAFIVIFIGGLLYLIIGIAKAKAEVCRKYGLECPHCHRVPKAFYAVSTMRSGICPRCKHEINT